MVTDTRGKKGLKEKKGPKEKKFDVIIIGAGPAGIFAALELTAKKNLKVLIIDKGRDIEERTCPSLSQKNVCRRCKPCGMLCGWGGAGAYSDGKLTLSPEVGGWLCTIIAEPKLKDLIDYADSIYLKFGAPKERIFGEDEAAIEKLAARAFTADLKLVASRIRHMGSDNCLQVLKALRKELGQRVSILTDMGVSGLETENGAVSGVRLENGEKILAGRVIAAPGREGANWLHRELGRLEVETRNNSVDIGVRVEVPAHVLEHLAETLFEAKFEFYSKSFDDRVRTFCMCPQGEVVIENYNDVITVNGHSYSNRSAPNSNLAILVSTMFTEPFREPISYGRHIAALANLISDGVIVQRLGDLKNGRRSTPERIKRGIVRPSLPYATPGDLSFVLPYRYLSSIVEMLEALDEVAPGINSRYTLLYGVEVKFYSARVRTDEHLQTSVGGLYVAGDGAGISRGLVQASVSGVIAGRRILSLF